MFTLFFDRLSTTGIVRKATAPEVTSIPTTPSFALVPQIEGAALQAQIKAEAARARRGDDADPLARVYLQLARARRHIASRLSARASLSRDAHR